MVDETVVQVLDLTDSKVAEGSHQNQVFVFKNQVRLLHEDVKEEVVVVVRVLVDRLSHFINTRVHREAVIAIKDVDYEIITAAEESKGAKTGNVEETKQN